MEGADEKTRGKFWTRLVSKMQIAQSTHSVCSNLGKVTLSMYFVPAYSFSQNVVPHLKSVTPTCLVRDKQTQTIHNQEKENKNISLTLKKNLYGSNIEVVSRNHYLLEYTFLL